jgi:hypothetical protein
MTEKTPSKKLNGFPHSSVHSHQLASRLRFLQIATAAAPLDVLPIAATTATAAIEPIFAPIEDHKKAMAAWSDALDQVEVVQPSTPKDVKREPRCVVGEERELHMASKKLKDGTRVFCSKDGKKTGNFYDANNLTDIDRA